MKLSKVELLHILGHDYIVRNMNVLHDDSGFSGRLLNNDKIIEIKNSLPDSEKAEVLLHEMIHAADQSTAPEDENLTEEQVFRLSAVLFSILVDNELVKI